MKTQIKRIGNTPFYWVKPLPFILINCGSIKLARILNIITVTVIIAVISVVLFNICK